MSGGSREALSAGSSEPPPLVSPREDVPARREVELIFQQAELPRQPHGTLCASMQEPMARSRQPMTAAMTLRNVDSSTNTSMTLERSIRSARSLCCCNARARTTAAALADVPHTME